MGQAEVTPVLFEAHGLMQQAPHRDRSQDFFCVEEDLGLLAVADGVGGAPAGDRASSLAVESLVEFLRRNTDPDEPVLKVLAEAAEYGNSRILSEAEARPDRHGMCTTLTACMLHDDSAYLVHVGDSRAYLIRDDAIQQLTTDQVARATVDRVERNVLLSALGLSIGSWIERRRVPVHGGDLILLCSDGLSGMTPPASLRSVCTMPGELAGRCERLIQLARSNGSRDDVTAVLAAVA